MDLPRQVARLFGIGFHGHAVPKEIDELIDRGVRSVILFKRNVQDAAQVQDLCAQVKRRAAGEPLAMTIDHEGGRVLRLGGEFTDIPSARQVGRANDENLCRQMGALMARELRAVNLDIDFAPVLDVDTNPNNPVIAARSLGPDPERVARLGCAVLTGMQAQGIAACAKHFPGHGDTNLDSHLTMPRIDHGTERIEQVELAPFKAAVKAGVANVMTSHILFSAIDPDLPATMSQKILTGILRKQLGFEGVIISDDLEMKAIAHNFGPEQTMIHGANAGINLFMVCHNHALQHKSIDLLIRAVERGDVSRELIEESVRRLDKLFAQYVKPATATRDNLRIVGCAEHRDIVDRIREISGPLKPGEDPTERWRNGENPL
jgi:beta-N-acetylhexosaminidase